METESSSEELDIHELHAFTIIMMNAYNKEAKKLTDEAEELIARGIAMREDAMQMLERANAIAHEYALAKDKALTAQQVMEEDSIDW